MTQLDNLDDDCLSEVLNRLPADHLFKMEQLNKRMKRLAAVMMQAKIRAISLTESSPDFSSCSNHTAISQDQILNLRPAFVGRERDAFFDALARDLFLNLLTKCSSVKSIHFGQCVVTEEVVVEAFERCPELECIKLGDSNIDEAQMHPALIKVGSRIVHFTRSKRTYREHWMLAAIAARCVNIRRVDWVIYQPMSDKLLSAFQQLPRNCRVSLKCLFLDRNIFDDVFDELDVNGLFWPTIGERLDRLESLKFIVFSISPFAHGQAPGPVRGVEFNQLKKFDFNPRRETLIRDLPELVTCLGLSHFPRLEEFGFSVRLEFTDGDFDVIFRRMPTVKKLIMYWYQSAIPEAVPQLPGLASIHQLKKLETIHLMIRRELDWCPENLIQHVEKYVDGIKSLKKLTVEMERCHCETRVYGAESESVFQWLQTLADEVKRIKSKQSRVQIDLIRN